MHKSIQLLGLLLTLLCGCLSPSFIQADCKHSTGKSSDNFFGGARFVLTPIYLCENVGVSLLGEAGSKNYRFNGTLGLFACDQYSFKVSGEYLTQNIHYNFSTGKAHRWVHQYAVGSTYQYRFCACDCIKGIQLNGCYSWAKNRHLPEDTCKSEKTFISRHIAGSWNVDVEAGLVLEPWNCSELIISLGYDQVRYRRDFHDKLRLSGVVATFEFEQRLSWGLDLDVIAEFKRPYNYLEGLLSWSKCYSCGDLSLGVYVGHTWGKYHLPSSTAVGGEIRWSWGVDAGNYACNTSCGPCAPVCMPCDQQALAWWLSRPAVYIPEVLAIAEQKSRSFPPPCFPPTSVPLRRFDNTRCGHTRLDISENFDGKGFPIKFSATGLPSGSKINRHGVLRIFNNCRSQAAYDVSVTGTTRCGSTTESFVLFNQFSTHKR